MTDLLPQPWGAVHRLLGVVEFHLRQDQAGIVAMELVDLPDQTCMGDFIAGLLDQRVMAQPEHCLGFLHRHLILELRAHDSVRLAFDREIRPCACSSYADGYAVSTGEITLAETLARGLLTPAVTHHEELALYLNGYGMVLDWWSRCTQDD
jgi:hypothetical protein